MAYCVFADSVYSVRAISYHVPSVSEKSFVFIVPVVNSISSGYPLDVPSMITVRVPGEFCRYIFNLTEVIVCPVAPTVNVCACQ